jgi:dihydroxy-acid dehydratase
MGLSSELLSKPVAGIAYTRKGFNNCHRHFRSCSRPSSAGYWAASALPLELPTISLGEGFLLLAPSPKTLSSDRILEGCAGTNS